MDINIILDIYANNLRDISKIISGQLVTSIKYIPNGLLPIFIETVRKINKDKHIIWADNKEEALMLFSDLLAIKANVTFIDYHEDNNPLVLKGLSDFLFNDSIITIIHNETLKAHFPDKDVLIENSININIDDSKNKIIEFCDNHYFEKVSKVVCNGQYSIKSKIIDVFSYGNNKPYRLRLDDNGLITNISYFNVVNQLSFNETFKSCKLIGKINNLSQTLNNYMDNQVTIWVKNSIPNNYQQCRHVFYQSESNQGIIYNATDQKPCDKDLNILIHQIKINDRYHIKSFIFVDDYVSQLFNYLKQQEVLCEPIEAHYSKGFIDYESGLAFYTYHEIFNHYYKYQLYDKLLNCTLENHNNNKSIFKRGDYVIHSDYGIGLFQGLHVINITNNQQQEMYKIVYQNNTAIYISPHNLNKLTKHVSNDDTPPQLSDLNKNKWSEKKDKIRKKIESIAGDLINIYSQRKCITKIPCFKDSEKQLLFESMFIYEDTEDQIKAMKAIKEDMEKSYPMDRLICGDVGFGKTELAMRAAFKAIDNHKQVVVIVPTTVLTIQHYETFFNRMKDFDIHIEYVNRFKTSKNIKDIKQKIKEGNIDILIGTSSICNKTYEFQNLGLLIIDEEQKFGVKTKEFLKNTYMNVDTLSLSATPIPRTLHFSLLGIRDFNIISTPPKNRLPIITQQISNDSIQIKKIIEDEIQRGGQVFFIHNHVDNINIIYEKIKNIVPQYEIRYIHGKLKGDIIEKTLIDFIKKEFDILISTNLIESGLDIPNVNTIIINNSHMFGLSDLYQMRGRVGRSNIQAFCYLVMPEHFTKDAQKRIDVLLENNQLGDGFKIAMRDLDIRGAGNILGTEQSGFMEQIGYETYCQIINDTISKIKDTNQNISLCSCEIDTDLSIMIPKEYILDTSERMKMYWSISNIKTLKESNKFKQTLFDCFGYIPDQINELIDISLIKWKANEYGFSKIIFKNKVVKIIANENCKYFTNIIDIINKNSDFQDIKINEKDMTLQINDILDVNKFISMMNSLFI